MSMLLCHHNLDAGINSHGALCSNKVFFVDKDDGPDLLNKPPLADSWVRSSLILYRN